MGAVEEMMCIVHVSVTNEVYMDVFWCRLCVNMIRERVIYLFWVGQEGCDE